MAKVLFFRDFLVLTNYIRPGEHDFGTFSDIFNFRSEYQGPGGQISKVILISHIVYQIVQFDELSLMAQYFFDLTFLSQVTAKNSAKMPKSMGLRGKMHF